MTAKPDVIRCVLETLMDLLSIFGRNEVDSWRDEWSGAAAISLSDLAASLISSFDAKIVSASWKDCLTAQRGFIATSIEPEVREHANLVVARVVAEANEALGHLAEYQTVWHDSPSSVEAPDQTASAAFDIAMTAAPIAAGTAAAVALPAMAVSTTTAFLGLVTVTAISWPIVIGGGAVAGVALATGGFKLSGMKDRARHRLRTAVHHHVVATLIKSGEKHRSVLDQLIAIFAETARAAKRHKL